MASRKGLSVLNEALQALATRRQRDMEQRMKQQQFEQDLELRNKKANSLDDYYKGTLKQGENQNQINIWKIIAAQEEKDKALKMQFLMQQLKNVEAEQADYRKQDLALDRDMLLKTPELNESKINRNNTYSEYLKQGKTPPLNDEQIMEKGSSLGLIPVGIDLKTGLTKMGREQVGLSDFAQIQKHQAQMKSITDAARQYASQLARNRMSTSGIPTDDAQFRRDYESAIKMIMRQVGMDKNAPNRNTESLIDAKREVDSMLLELQKRK